MKARLGALAAAALLAGWLPILARAPAAQAAGCDPGPYCGSLAVYLSGYPNGSFKTTNSSGIPDGVMSCSLTWGVMSPSSCSHRFEWDHVVAPTIYWKFVPVDTVASYINTGVPTGSSILVSGQTIQLNREFLWNDPHELHVFKSGTGAGTVTSSLGPIDCGSACLWWYDKTYTITLTATPSTGSHFVKWLGLPSCNESTNPVCVHSMLDNLTNDMTAVFALNATPSPVPSSAASPQPSNTPTPTVKPSVKPSGTPGVQPTTATQPTAAAGPTSPASTAGASAVASNEAPSSVPGSPPAASQGVASGGPATAPAESSAGPVGPTPNVGDPAVGGGSDSTGLIIVIIVAALIIGGGLVFLGLQLRAVARRPGPPPT